MKTLKYLLFTPLILLLTACEEDVRSTDFMNDFPTPSNVQILVEVADDYSGNVKITPTAQGVHLFEIDFGDGSTPEQYEPGTTLYRQYQTGVYTIVVDAISVEGVSIQHSETIQVLSSCVDETSTNENPSLGPLNFTFMGGNGRFFPIGGAGAVVVENPALDFDNLSCYVHQFERKNNCAPSAGAIKVLPAMLSIAQDEEKKFSLDVYAQDTTADVTLYLLTSPPIEITHSITEVGQWEQLEFDLSEVQGKSFNRLIIYFDKGQSCDGSVYYFDNLKLID